LLQYFDEQLIYSKFLLQDSNGLIHRPGNPVALQTKEGYAAIDEAINFLEGQIGQPFPELTMSHGMSRACQDLIDVNGPTGVLGKPS
jgi:hypothetical protein